MKYEVIDNFLQTDTYNYIKDIIISSAFNWQVRPLNNSLEAKGKFQLAHFTHEHGKVLSIISDVITKPLMAQLKQTKGYNKVGVTRGRINGFIPTSENIALGLHKDIEDTEKFYTLLLYLTTDNGGTRFETGEKINSVENRALIFKAHYQHETITQTNNNLRINININYNVID
jgi:hypothetical protein